MGDVSKEFSRSGVVRNVVLPAALVFLIPVLSLLFFRHARDRFDAQALAATIQDAEADARLTPEQRAEVIAHFREHPYSEDIEREPFASQADSTIRFYYATFRWMIRLAAASIIATMVVFALAAACLALSRRSQRAQYLCLAVGWQILRAFGAFQVLAQGTMVVALSFWVTALWFHVYSLKLIVIAALLAVVAAFAVLKAIFHKPDTDLRLDGKVLDPAGSARLWEDLGAICDKVGTHRPDNIVVGVDDNFFVTEAPVHVDGKVCRGRTLFVSLGLLKQMSGAEAEAVLAHEMAHFSGDDTLYSRKTAPLLARFDNYLAVLDDNPLALPVHAFMRGFRVLLELTRGEQSRGREYRADRIAGEATSPRDLASALLRITAYSDFRSKIQQDLFDQERALEAADVSARLEAGFQEYARGFLSKPDLERLSTSHPFDSHPTMSQRLHALGTPLESEDVAAMLVHPGDGRWYAAIDDAEAVERGLWAKFEDAFRQIHEGSLPYRLLPETDEEREIVARSFPDVVFESKKGPVTLLCDAIQDADWPTPIAFSEIVDISMNGNDLVISYNRQGAKTTSIPTKGLGPRQAEVIQAIGAYYVRYMTAASHRDEKSAQADSEPE